MTKRALLISCFDWYKKRLEPIREVLSSKGYDVTVLTSDFDHIRKRGISPRYDEVTYVHVPSYSRNISPSRVISHISFGRAVGKWLDRLHPELIYLMVPPNYAAKHCRRYREGHPNTRLYMDVLDLWPESMPVGAASKTAVAKAWKRWRDDCVQVADHVFTECKLYQEQLQDVLSPERTSVLYLYKEQTEEERALVQDIVCGRTEDSDGVVKLAYLGSMNYIIDVDGIVEVIGNILREGLRCELHAIGDGEGRKSFEAAVLSTGCTAHFYGAIYDELEKIRILAPCDYALNMMKETSQVGLTIKSIDYLSYGLPLINNIKGDTWRLIESNQIGINIICNAVLSCTINHLNVYDVYNRTFSKASFIKGVEGILI